LTGAKRVKTSHQITEDEQKTEEEEDEEEEEKMAESEETTGDIDYIALDNMKVNNYTQFTVIERCHNKYLICKERRYALFRCFFRSSFNSVFINILIKE
jgi:hypothetical protein